MAKSKSKSAQANTAAAQPNKNEVKSLSSVQQGAVTKPSQTPQARSKNIAAQTVKALEANKKSKKVKEPSSDLDSDESEDDQSDEGSSASSASSEDESEDEAPKQAKSNGVKTNGVSKAEPAGEAGTSDSSESSDASASDSEDEEEPTPAPKAAKAAAPKAVVDKSDDDSEEASNDSSDDDEDEDEEDDEEDEKPKGGVKTSAVGGKLDKESKNDDSEEDDDDSAESEEESDGSDDSDESDEEKPAPKTNKRKADAEAPPPAKKAKNAEVDDLDDATKKNLFVGHISYNVDEEWLRREFETYGELTRVVHMVDRETQRPRGFGYIEYANAEDGVSAQEAMNGKEIDGRAINVDFSRPRTEQQPRQERAKQYGDRVRSPPSSTIFVANLAFSATSDAVGEEFGKHAEVVGVRLPTDRETGEPKGFGYVEFASVDEAEKAFSAMEGQSIMGRVPRLDYSTPRPDRNGDSPGGRGGFGRGGGRGGFERGGRGGGRGRGGFDRGGRGGRGGSTNRGGFGDFKGKKMSFS